MTPAPPASIDDLRRRRARLVRQAESGDPLAGARLDAIHREAGRALGATQPETLRTGLALARHRWWVARGLLEPCRDVFGADSREAAWAQLIVEADALVEVAQRWRWRVGDEHPELLRLSGEELIRLGVLPDPPWRVDLADLRRCADRLLRAVANPIIEGGAPQPARVAAALSLAVEGDRAGALGQLAVAGRRALGPWGVVREAAEALVREPAHRFPFR